MCLVNVIISMKMLDFNILHLNKINKSQWAIKFYKFPKLMNTHSPHPTLHVKSAKQVRSRILPLYVVLSVKSLS